MVFMMVKENFHDMFNVELRCEVFDKNCPLKSVLAFVSYENWVVKLYYNRKQSGKVRISIF